MKSLGWWIFEHVPMGRLAPWYLGLLLGRRPRRVKTASDAEEVTLP